MGGSSYGIIFPRSNKNEVLKQLQNVVNMLTSLYVFQDAIQTKESFQAEYDKISDGGIEYDEFLQCFQKVKHGYDKFLKTNKKIELLQKHAIETYNMSKQTLPESPIQLLILILSKEPYMAIEIGEDDDEDEEVSLQAKYDNTNKLFKEVFNCEFYYTGDFLSAYAFEFLRPYVSDSIEDIYDDFNDSSMIEIRKWVYDEEDSEGWKWIAYGAFSA